MPQTYPYTLIFRGPFVGGLEEAAFHFTPSPERIQRERRALTTLVELPQAIYRESHGEGIQNVSLEGTFGVKTRLINGASLTGHQSFELLERLIEDYWKRLPSTPTLQVEYHDHIKNKHYYAEIMSFSDPKGSENKMHDRYMLELRLYAPIGGKIEEIQPEKYIVARKELATLSNVLGKLKEAGATLSSIPTKANQILNQKILSPLNQLTRALRSFVTGATDVALFPLRGLTRLANNLSDAAAEAGELRSAPITTLVNDLRRARRSALRLFGVGDLFTQPLSDAIQDFERFFEEGSQTQDTPAYTGVRQAALRSGDTLQRVAVRELGEASRWRDIAQLNSLNSNADLTGRSTLLIPATPQTPNSAIALDVEDTRYQTEERLYGRDLLVVETSRGKISLVLSEGDLATVAGTANLRQAVMMKTRIKQGSLLENPAYGIRANIGKPQSQEDTALLQWGLQVAAETDPRISRAQVEIERTGNVTNYNYSLTPVGASGSHPVNVVVGGLA